MMKKIMKLCRVKSSNFPSSLPHSPLLKLSHHTTPTPPKFSTPHTFTFPINMSTISASKKFFTTTTDTFSSITTTPPPNFPKFPTFHQPKLFPKLLPTPTPHLLTHSSRKSLTPAFSKSSEEAEELSAEPEDEWLNKLPDKKKPLYSHSLPCIEAWLRSLGFYQSKEDRAVWLVEKPEWHAQLSLDITDLYIRYMKSGPGSLEKDVERRFSYALSREDIENAVLGGP